MYIAGLKMQGAVIQSPSESRIPDRTVSQWRVCLSNHPHALPNKYLLSWLRKLKIVVVHRSESGRLFHMVCAETLKAPEAIFVFVRGMTRV